MIYAVLSLALLAPLPPKKKDQHPPKPNKLEKITNNLVTTKTNISISSSVVGDRFHYVVRNKSSDFVIFKIKDFTELISKRSVIKHMKWRTVKGYDDCFYLQNLSIEDLRFSFVGNKYKVVEKLVPIQVYKLERGKWVLCLNTKFKCYMPKIVNNPKIMEFNGRFPPPAVVKSSLQWMDKHIEWIEAVRDNHKGDPWYAMWESYGSRVRSSKGVWKQLEKVQAAETQMEKIVEMRQLEIYLGEVNFNKGLMPALFEKRFFSYMGKLSKLYQMDEEPPAVLTSSFTSRWPETFVSTERIDPPVLDDFGYVIKAPKEDEEMETNEIGLLKLLIDILFGRRK